MDDNLEVTDAFLRAIPHGWINIKRALTVKYDYSI
jgi:hypothetical protein